MELQLVTKSIYNEGDHYCLEEDMNYRCEELLEEKNLPLVTFKLGTLEYSTLVNNNNLDDYYIANDLLREIEEKERTIKYYSLTI